MCFNRKCSRTLYHHQIIRLKKSEKMGTTLLYNRYRMGHCYEYVKFEFDDIL